jgi:phospholipid/cholesterol/gamma-HCH transport system permease protein
MGIPVSLFVVMPRMVCMILSDVLLTALKGIVFGAAVASVCCHHGLSVQSSFTEVPQQTTKAMINSPVLCFILDVCITVPVYL